MTRRTLAAIVCVLLTAAPARAAGTAREMYVAALAREQAARAALNDSNPGPTAAANARAAIAAYQALVRRYPGSGYTDNALWQAGSLSIDLFLRFGRPRDQATGVRLLRLLASDYRSSTLAARVPGALARLTDRRPAPPDRTEPAVAPRSTPPARPQAAALRDAGTSAATESFAMVKAIRRTVLSDTVRIVIELDGEVGFQDERVSNPLRLFLDLPHTRAASALVDRTLRFDGDADIVRSIHIGQQPGGSTRVVVDAAGVSSYSVYPLYTPYRLVIDCVRGTEPGLARPPAPLAGRTLPADWGRRLPNAKAAEGAVIAAALAPSPARVATVPRLLASRTLDIDARGTWPLATPRATALIADAVGTVPHIIVSTPAPTIEVALAPPAFGDAAITAPRRATGGYSMARQLGLGVSRIVIDPGHGGHDPGAQGPSIQEAELVLNVALRLEKLLRDTPGTDVILTRRTDEFVSLPERTAIANRENADLFLSIHANASDKPSASGVETYFLNFASTMSAASVAARENAASGQSMGALPDLLKAIALTNKIDESRDFATEVQRAMIDRLRGVNRNVKDLRVKQAPFAVLIGAAMPSVLAEISFVTNAQEAKLLRSNAYRQRIAEALFKAVRTYQASLKNVGTVAHQ